MLSSIPCIDTTCMDIVDRNNMDLFRLRILNKLEFKDVEEGNTK
jgi:hypothetical protein